MMPVDPIVIAAIASCLGAAGTFMIGIVSMMSLLQGLKINKRGVENAAMLKVIDTNVDGHLSRLTEMAAGVDPLAAALAAAKVLSAATEAQVAATAASVDPKVAALAAAQVLAAAGAEASRRKPPPARNHPLRRAPAKAK